MEYPKFFWEKLQVSEQNEVMTEIHVYNKKLIPNEFCILKLYQKFLIARGVPPQFVLKFEIKYMCNIMALPTDYLIEKLSNRIVKSS